MTIPHSERLPPSKHAINDPLRQVLKLKAANTALNDRVDVLENSLRFQTGGVIQNIAKSPKMLLCLPYETFKILSAIRKRNLYRKIQSAMECGLPNDNLRAILDQDTSKTEDLHRLYKVISLPKNRMATALEKFNVEQTNRQKAVKMLHERAVSLQNIKTDFVALQKKITAKQKNIRPQKTPVNVALCLHNTVVTQENGYALRSHEVLKGLKSLGVNICAYQRSEAFNEQSVQINDITYSLLRSINPEQDLLKYISAYKDALVHAFISDNITLVHACSNYITGLAAGLAAKQLGLGFVYEVRGFWELTRLSSQPEFADSLGFNTQKYLETQCAILADKVIALSGPIRDELIDRGIEPQKIIIARNGATPVTCDYNIDDNTEIKGLKAKTVIGFIGSITPYEGLDVLLHAIKSMRVCSNDLQVLIVGDGPYFEPLKALTEKLGLKDYIVFTGRIQHADIAKAYALSDVVYSARNNSLVGQIVSPLKPLEAMSYAKPVIASRLKALEDVIGEGEQVFYIQPDSVSELCAVLTKLIKMQKIDIIKRGQAASIWCRKNRQWKSTIGIIYKVYSTFKT